MTPKSICHRDRLEIPRMDNAAKVAGLAHGHKVDGNIMHISTVEQFQEAKALFAAHNLSGHFTFLLTDQAKRDISGQGEFYTRVTCTRKHGRPKLEEVSLIEAIPGYRGPWTHAPVKIQNSQVQIVPRVPVRITAPQHLRSCFLATPISRSATARYQ